jgi:hypothetical protein
LKSTNENAPLIVASLSKRVTGSDVFINAPLTVTSLVAVDVDPTVMDHDQDEQEQTHHCQWRVYTVLHKDTADSGALPFVDFKFYFYHSYY